jgi:hypothetical protein
MLRDQIAEPDDFLSVKKVQKCIFFPLLIVRIGGDLS